MLWTRTTAPRKYLTKLDGQQLNHVSRSRQSPQRWHHLFLSRYKLEYLWLWYQGVSLWCVLTTSWLLFRFVAFSTKLKGASSPAVPVMAVAKPLICRVPSSVEAINHELENVFIREGWEHGIQVGAHLRCWDLLETSVRAWERLLVHPMGLTLFSSNCWRNNAPVSTRTGRYDQNFISVLHSFYIPIQYTTHFHTLSNFY